MGPTGIAFQRIRPISQPHLAEIAHVDPAIAIGAAHEMLSSSFGCPPPSLPIYLPRGASTLFSCP
jgi:hypothetical protein